MKTLVVALVILTGAHTASACIGCLYRATYAISSNSAITGIPFVHPPQQPVKGAPATQVKPSETRKAAAFGGSIAPNAQEWSAAVEARIPDANFELQHVTGNAWLSVMSQKEYTPHATFIDSFLESLKRDNPEAGEVSRKEHAVGDAKFTLLRARLPMQGASVGMLCAVTSNKFGSLQLIFMTNDDLYDEYLTDFISVVNTFKKP